MTTRTTNEGARAALARAREGARERAITEGLGALGAAELVALVLGTGRAGEPVSLVAASLLEACGGVAGLARAGLGELAARPGVGLAKGARLAAAMELGKRVAAASQELTRESMRSSRAVDAWARPRLATLDHEELWVLVLDGHQGLRAARRVAMGGLHGVHVAARDPLRIALREGGSAIVLVHNHPSGDPSPSPEDIEFTHRIARAAEVVGAPLVDHVVVARGGFRSLLDLGELERIEPGAWGPPRRKRGLTASAGGA